MNNNSFFGIDFYPTPTEVIERMLMGVDVTDKYILEPSAGSGNIVDVLNERAAKQVYIRGYKKGTMHFEFIDEEVWAKFNQTVANIRGWHLPQNVKTKTKKS